MKLKGLTKLVLAGTALAATAATLTTSTYAWYVTNTKVEATGISGVTAGESVSGSLLISELDAQSAADLPSGYTTSVSFQGQTLGSDLDPQSKAIKIDNKYYYKTSDTAKDDNKTYYTLTKETNGYAKAEATINENTDWSTIYEESSDLVWVKADGKLTTATMVTFSFWLKASEAMNNVKVFTTFANTSTITDDIKQTFYTSAGLPTGSAVGETFVVDSVYALRMEVTQQAYTLTPGENAGERDYSADTKTASGDPTVATVGAVENHNATNTSNQYASPAGFSDWTGGDANKYYFGVMKQLAYGSTDNVGTSPAAPGVNTADQWKTINLDKDVDYLMTINIWLEGTDAQCWDSCVGQDFTLNLKFEKAGA